MADKPTTIKFQINCVADMKSSFEKIYISFVSSFIFIFIFILLLIAFVALLGHCRLFFFRI